MIRDFGRDPTTFDLERFGSEAPRLTRADWLGATWSPTLVARSLWHRVGGYSIEFSPGMSSENDFSMKLWSAGCRVFLGVGDSLVYHFAEVSTRRMRKNDGRRQFLMKWGMTQSGFGRYYLRRGEPMPPGENGSVLPDPAPSWRLRWKDSGARRDGASAQRLARGRDDAFGAHAVEAVAAALAMLLASFFLAGHAEKRRLLQQRDVVAPLQRHYFLVGSIESARRNRPPKPRIGRSE